MLEASLRGTADTDRGQAIIVSAAGVCRYARGAGPSLDRFAIRLECCQHLFEPPHLLGRKETLAPILMAGEGATFTRAVGAP